MATRPRTRRVGRQGTTDYDETELGLMPPSEHAHNNNLEVTGERGVGQAAISPSLRICKGVVLIFVGICLCVATVASKVSLVSITGRMFSMKDERTGSVLFFQLVLLMMIPEAISWLRCLIWGVIGKSWVTYPRPSGVTIVWVSRSTLLMTKINVNLFYYMFVFLTHIGMLDCYH